MASSAAEGPSKTFTRRDAIFGDLVCTKADRPRVWRRIKADQLPPRSPTTVGELLAIGRRQCRRGNLRRLLLRRRVGAQPRFTLVSGLSRRNARQPDRRMRRWQLWPRTGTDVDRFSTSPPSRRLEPSERSAHTDRFCYRRDRRGSRPPAKQLLSDRPSDVLFVARGGRIQFIWRGSSEPKSEIRRRRRRNLVLPRLSLTTVGLLASPHWAAGKTPT